MRQEIFNEVNDVVCDASCENKKNRAKITIVTKYGNKYKTTYNDWQQHQTADGTETDIICELRGGGQLHIGIEDIESIII